MQEIHVANVELKVSSWYHYMVKPSFNHELRIARKLVNLYYHYEYD